MIPIVEEAAELYENTRAYERCHFCRAETKTWHENTNNPVCSVCAKQHKVAELPDFGKRIRANKRKMKRMKDKP
jgi:hypothetical protein